MKVTANDDFIPNIIYNVFRKCNPDWRIRSNPVDNYDLTYVIKGNARYTIDGSVYELGPGDLLFLTDGVEKEAVTYPKKLMQCFSVNFSALYPSAKFRPPSFPQVNHIGIRRDLIDLFRELTASWSERQEGYVMKSRALLMLILNRLREILLYKTDTADDYRINKITRYITMHYSDKLTVKGLAELVNLNKAYLGYLFKQQTGVSIYKYIRQIRVQNAENMLLSGNYKVQEVAEQCGFSDAIHFYKLFREIRGYAPSRCKPRK